uniref:Maspardin n=1 Tax=Strigamia maritima TaxID=126957 RepID=T1JNR9_STRMM
MSDLGSSQEYTSFRSSVSQNKIVVDNDPAKVWTYYDAGPRHIRCPLVCIPPVSGTADVYYKQLLSLSARGYRVLSVEYPVYWSMPDFCEGFRKFLDHLNLDKVHLCGSSLGGFLAQKFAEYTRQCPRVQSLFLCNSFCDTSVFQYTDSCFIFWITPALILKKMIMGNFPKTAKDPEIIRSIDFMVEKLDSLNQRELASRLTLNCTSSYVEPQKVNTIPVTIMDVFDEYALSQRVKEDLYKCYPNAKLAHLKGGGNFPYLSRSDEVNLHLRNKM